MTDPWHDLAREAHEASMAYAEAYGALSSAVKLFLDGTASKEFLAEWLAEAEAKKRRRLDASRTQQAPLDTAVNGVEGRGNDDHQGGRHDEEAEPLAACDGGGAADAADGGGGREAGLRRQPA